VKTHWRADVRRAELKLRPYDSVAMVAFFVGAATGFPRAAVGAVITALVVSCVTLPAAIVFGYAVRAAEREERGEPPGHERPGH